MRNIWIPHIEKTGGMTLMHSLEKTNLLFHKEKNFQIYHNNGYYLHIHHNNPFKKKMRDWLKILIVREPISRYISAFNFQKWINWVRYKEVDKRTIEEFMNSYEHKSHIEYLNGPLNDIIFSFDNIKNVDVSLSNNYKTAGLKVIRVVMFSYDSITKSLPACISSTLYGFVFLLNPELLK